MLLHYFLRNKGYTMWEGIYFSTPASAFSLLALCLVFEREVTEQENILTVRQNGFVFLAIVVLAITTSVSGFGIIKELGSVSNKVLIMLRNALLIYPATQVYGDVVTPVQILGYAMTMVGTTTFAVFRVSDEVLVRRHGSCNDLRALAEEKEDADRGQGGWSGGGGGGGGRGEDEMDSLLANQKEG